MKIIEIITLHRVTNFGSLLQTYATEQALRKLGVSVRIIDFVPEGLSFKRAIWPKGGSIFKKTIKFLPLLACNVYQFHMSNHFLRHYVTLTDDKYRSYGELKSRKLEADIYLSGSDQVWNTQNSNPKEDLGAYYLAFVQNKPKIAYAGSFGRTDFSTVEKEQIKKWLEQYCSISVREDSGLQLLSELGLKGKHVVDPTFLLDRAQWLDFYSSHRKAFPDTGYVFVYNLNRNKIIEEIAIAVAKEKGLRIVNFADTFEFIHGAKNKLFNTPLDFLGYIANADYVITDSFHGTSFSINLGRQFVTVAAPKYNTRIESVLRMMSLEDRLVSNSEKALQVLYRPIDYAKTNEIVGDRRRESIIFLENALNGQCE